MTLDMNCMFMAMTLRTFDSCNKRKLADTAHTRIKILNSVVSGT